MLNCEEQRVIEGVAILADPEESDIIDVWARTGQAAKRPASFRVEISHKVSPDDAARLLRTSADALERYPYILPLLNSPGDGFSFREHDDEVAVHSSSRSYVFPASP